MAVRARHLRPRPRGVRRVVRAFCRRWATDPVFRLCATRAALWAFSFGGLLIIAAISVIDSDWSHIYGVLDFLFA